jgi:hypothetical protein
VGGGIKHEYTTRRAAGGYTRQQHKQKVQPHAQIKFDEDNKADSSIATGTIPLNMVKVNDRNM